ncbi:Mss4-like protein [Crassisporium funariophilum]|nr:Mss4-like protein [Crassisporium funariophilum]
MPTIYVDAQCDCGVSTFRVGFDKSLIPFEHGICHCNTCRHSTGQMAFYYLPITRAPLIGKFGEIPITKSDMSMYRSSEKTVRYFCARCSTNMFKCKNGKEWSVSGGAIHKTEGIAKLGYHKFVADTLDGGLADQLTEVDGKKLPRYSYEEGSEELPVGWRSPALKDKNEERNAKQLRAYCHCGTIKFYITRPDDLSSATIRNIKDEKWWLAPCESHELTRYLAGHCACSNCRRGSGFEVQSWAFVSRGNVHEMNSDEPIELYNDHLRPAGLKQYLSSPGKYREFCGTCGANVFWWHVGRPDVIDISVGLLDHEQAGVRAEQWLKWHKHRVSFSEDAQGTKSTIEGLVSGMAHFEEDVC